MTPVKNNGSSRPPYERKPLDQKAVRLALLIGGSLIVLAMTYGAGMRRQMGKLKEMNEQRKIVEQQYREAQRDLHYRLAVAYQLEGRRQVALALDEMERRNFGVAQERLTNAVKLLETAQSANTNAVDLSAFIPRLTQTNLTATENIGEQRTALNTLAREMDAKFTGFVPDFLTAKTQEDAANPIKKVTMNDVPLPPGNEIGRKSKQ
jgi:septation ring formation regulator EzrA